MKKLLSILSAAAVFGLAACGSGGNDSPITSGPPEITGPLTTDPGASLELPSPDTVESSPDMSDSGPAATDSF